MKKKIIITVCALTLIFLVVMLAYQAGYTMGRSSSDAVIEDLKYHLAEVDKEVSGAVVTKRVSEQMGDIADQQVLIANVERDNAISQQKRADVEAANARDAAHEAEMLRDKAELASVEATKQRDKAILAEEAANKERENAVREKNKAEMLNYRRLAASLATSALTHSLAGHEEFVAMSLAYWSYEFLKQYGGNKYNGDTFKALLKYSEMEKEFLNSGGGRVTDMCMVPGGKDRMVFVTDYGQITLCTDTWPTHIMQSMGQRSFRAVSVKGKDIYAMTSTGAVLKLDFTGNVKSQSADLKPSQNGRAFTHMKPLGDDLFVLSEGKNLYLMDVNTLTIKNTLTLSSPLTCIYPKNGGLTIHMKNSGTMFLTEDGTLRNGGTTKNRVITSGYWDRKTGLTMLGDEQGGVNVLNRWDRDIVSIPGLKCAITSVLIQDTIGVITSYDHKMLVCNMPKYLMSSGYSFAEEMNMQDPPTDRGNGPGEWVINAEIDYKSCWPLCLCNDEKRRRVWVGTSNNEVDVLSIDVDAMAEAIKKKLGNKNLTDSEWRMYMGDVKYETIK